jgi:hypothetical protein
MTKGIHKEHIVKFLFKVINVMNIITPNTRWHPTHPPTHPIQDDTLPIFKILILMKPSIAIPIFIFILKIKILTN